MYMDKNECAVFTYHDAVLGEECGSGPEIHTTSNYVGRRELWAILLAVGGTGEAETVVAVISP